jgi:hypothetical protein
MTLGLFLCSVSPSKSKVDCKFLLISSLSIRLVNVIGLALKTKGASGVNGSV